MSIDVVYDRTMSQGEYIEDTGTEAVFGSGARLFVGANRSGGWRSYVALTEREFPAVDGTMTLADTYEDARAAVTNLVRAVERRRWQNECCWWERARNAAMMRDLEALTAAVRALREPESVRASIAAVQSGAD